MVRSIQVIAFNSHAACHSFLTVLLFTRESVLLVIALVLFEKYQGERFNPSMLDDFETDNTFHLPRADLRRIGSNLAAIKNSKSIESIYERIGLLSRYEKKAVLSAFLTHKLPVLYAPYLFDHIEGKKIEAFEASVLEVLKKIDDLD